MQVAAGETPRVYYGCDFHVTLENIEDAIRAPERYSINHKGYLLVEFSDFHVPKTTDEIFAKLMRAGLRPIVTHPERNQILQRRMADLEPWVAQGAHLKVTAQSFLGRFGRTAKAFSDELMSRGLVHFVASDAHDTDWRPPVMDESFRYVTKKYGEEAAVRVFEENPRAALAGVALLAAPMPIKRKKWLGIW